jgi:hypothetical protein
MGDDRTVNARSGAAAQALNTRLRTDGSTVIWLDHFSDLRVDE